MPDDPTIADATVLWRRIPPNGDVTSIVFDGTLQRQRPSSGNFDDHPDGSGMSVTMNLGQPNDQALQGHEGFLLVAFTAGEARALGLSLMRQPEPNDPNHVEIIGPKTKRVKNWLAKNCGWVIPPPE